MHVLILNWRDPEHPSAGGAEAYLAEIARLLLARGDRVTWLAGAHPARSGKRSSPPRTELTDFADGLMNLSRRGRSFSVYPAAALTYLHRLRGRVDLVIDGENGIPFFSPLYSRVPKIALVHHVHREIFELELPAPLALLGRWLEGRLMPWAYRREWFVAVSESTRRELLELGVAADRMAVVHNGLDTRRFTPGTDGEPSDILWLGRLRRYKSVETLLDAAARLHAAGSAARVVIAGDGPERAPLERHAARLGLAERIEFLGFVGEERKLRLLRGARIVVQTSRKEGWGMTVLEANACGVPVVAADVPGLRDSVRHRMTGLLVPWGDAESLAAALGNLLRDDPLHARLSAGARAWARSFSWRASGARWLELIDARSAGGAIPSALRHDRISSPTSDAGTPADVARSPDEVDAPIRARSAAPQEAPLP